MRYGFTVIAFIAAFILQTSIFGQLAIFGCSANLILCFSVVLSFIYSENSAGLVVGAAAALIYDAAFCPYLGMTAIPLALTAVACIFAREFVLNREKPMSMLIVSAGAVVVYYNLHFMMIKFADMASSYIYMLEHLILYIVLNVIVMMIIYICMIGNATSNRNSRYKKWAGL